MSNVYFFYKLSVKPVVAFCFLLLAAFSTAVGQVQSDITRNRDWTGVAYSNRAPGGVGVMETQFALRYQPMKYVINKITATSAHMEMFIREDFDGRGMYGPQQWAIFHSRNKDVSEAGGIINRYNDIFGSRQFGANSNGFMRGGTAYYMTPGTQYFFRGWRYGQVDVSGGGDWTIRVLSNSVPWYYTHDLIDEPKLALGNSKVNHDEFVTYHVVFQGVHLDTIENNVEYKLRPVNFSLIQTGDLNATIESVVQQVNRKDWLVTVKTTGAKGTVLLKMDNSFGAANTVDNLPYTLPDAYKYEISRGVDKIVLDSSNPDKNNYTKVKYLIYLDAPNISGLKASNFNLVTTGNTQAAITDLKPVGGGSSGGVWEMTVSVTGGTYGTVKPVLVNSTGVLPKLGGLPFNNAQTFTSARAMPVITNISPKSGKPGDVITVTGDGFTSGQDIFYFGAVKAANIVFKSKNEYQVTVPSGATMAPVFVQNSVSALSCWSSAIFNVVNTQNDAALNSIYLQRKPDINLPANSAPASIRTADINNDNYPDLIFTAPTSKKLMVLINNKVGGFNSSVDLAMPDVAYPAIAIADVTGDGKLDIIGATNGSVQQLIIFPNLSVPSGAAAFGSAITRTITGFPSNINVTDIDKDGRPDILVALDGSNKVYVYPNYTPWPGQTVTLDAPVEISSGRIGVRGMTTGDIDNDQKPEIIIADYGTDAAPGSTVTIFKNTVNQRDITSSGLSNSNTLLSVVGNNPYGLALGDLDGDGFADLVVQSASSQLIVYRNKGGYFEDATKQGFALPASPRSGEVTIRDLDGDGKPEIISSNYTNGLVSVFRNKSVSGTISGGSFVRLDYRSGTQTQAAAIADFNLDGKGDMAVANTGSSTISLFTYQLPPIVDSFSPVVARAGADIVITGKNFNTTAAKNVVYLGAVKATVKTASATSLTVTVPEGSTFGMITVLDSDSKLAGQSSGSFGVENTEDQLFFSSRNDYAVAGSALQSMVAADLNLDGYPELITVAPSSTGSKLVVSKNTGGTAWFKAASVTSVSQTITGASNVYVIASGDLDGDGRKDVVAADYDNGKVLVFLNEAGTLKQYTAATFAVDANPTSITVADIDGDGKPDIITAGKTTNTVSVLRNISSAAGSVNFEPQTKFAVGSAPFWVSVADLDADGKPEIITANSGSNNVSVLKNHTAGSSLTFAAAQNFSTGAFPAYVTAADLDGDGKPELAVSNQNDNNVSVLKNNSTTGVLAFATSVNYSTGSASKPVSIAIGDLDADGKPEMAVTNTGNNTLSIFRNNTVSNTINSSSFAKADYAAGTDPVSVIIADLNKNAKSDIAVANRTGNSISIFQNVIPPVVTAINPAAGIPGTVVTITGKNFNAAAANNIVYFGATAALVTSATPTSVTVEVPAGATSNTVSVLDKASGLSGFSSAIFEVTNAVTDGSFAYRTAFTTETGAAPSSVIAADIDGDGHSELISIDPAGKIYVERNSGQAAIGASLFQNYTFTIDAGVSGVRTADIDGDGKSDLIVSNSTTNKIYVLLNTSSAGISFATPQSFAAGTNPGSIAIADLDGDGKPDVAVTGKNTDVVTILRNISLQGTVLFSPSVALTAGSKISYLTIADLNNDGKPDVITANAGTDASPGNTVTVLYNNTSPGLLNTGSFSSQDITVGNKPSAIAVADVDGDGWKDLAVTGAADNKVSVLKNTSTQSSITFDTAIDFVTGGSPSAVAISDVNGDAFPDLAVLNSADNTISVLLNANQGAVNTNSFSVKQDYSAGNSANSLVIADLNNDGKAELAAANTGGTISVMRYIPVPVITSVSPLAAPVYTSVVITGRNFNPDPAKNVVFFGATKANVLSASATVLTVAAPAEATYYVVSVLDAESGLTAYSTDRFILSNPNVVDSELKLSSFNAPVNIPTQNKPATVAMGDLDGDGKTDLVVVNSESGSISVYHNEAADGDISSSSFPAASSATFTVGDSPNSVVVKDVDGDGKPDITVNNYASKTIFVLRNTTVQGQINTSSFAAPYSVSTSSGVNMIALSDMNGDGKPDLLTANAGNSTVTVYRNTSAAGTVSFSAVKANYTVGGNPWSVMTADLNGDGKPELLTSNDGANSITILPNTSGPGVFNTSSFGSPTTLSSAGGARSVAAGDLDGDGKTDLAVINKSENFVTIYSNTSSSGLSFGTGVKVATGETPYGVSIGDINGDKKPDLVTGNMQSVSVIRNIHAGGAIAASSFADKVDIRTSSTPQVVAIGDLDNNSTAELVVANPYLNSLSIISTKITAKIVFDPLADKTYGDADFDGGATSNTQAAIIYKSSNELVATIVDGKIHIVGAGETVITASLPHVSNFADAQEVSQPLKVKKRDLNVLVDPAEKMYGKPNPRYKYTIDGLVNGDTEDDIEVLPVIKAVDMVTNTPVDELTKVGTYPIVLINVPVDNNYTLVVTGNDLIIHKALLTAKADNIQTPAKDPLDGTFVEPTFTISYNGWVGGDNKINYTFGEAPVAAPVGTIDYTVKESYPIIVTGGLDDNYEFERLPGTLDVGKTPTTLAVVDFPLTKVYGDAPYDIVISTTNSENPTINYRALNPEVATINPSNGKVTIVGAGIAKFLISQEYTENFAAPEDLYLTLTVSKAVLRVSLPSGLHKTYGQDNPQLVLRYEDFVNGDTKADINQLAIASAVETINPLKLVDKHTPVSLTPYPVIVTEANEAADDNYTFAYTQGEFTVLPARLKVTARSYTRVYGDANPALLYDYSGFVNEETEYTPGVITTAPTVSTTALIGSGVDIYPTVAANGVAPNYTIEYVDGKLTIDPARIIVSVTDSHGASSFSKDYAQANPAFEIRYSGFKNGETSAVLLTPATIPATYTERTSAGVYNLVAEGASAANYTFSYNEDAVFTINKVHLSVKAKDVSRNYGAENPAFEFVYSTLAAWDTEASIDVKPTATSEGKTAAVAGSPYNIVLTGGSATNYILDLNNTGRLTVNRAPLTIKAENKNRQYGEANPALTVAYEYFVNGETASVLTQLPVLKTTANLSSAQGNYPITFDVPALSPNYEITPVDGTLSVGLATLYVTAESKTRKYGEANPVYTVRYDGFVNGDDESKLDTKPVVNALNVTAATPVGPYPVTFTTQAASLKYSIVHTDGSLIITKAPLTLEAKEVSRPYNTANPVFDFRELGFLNGDTRATAFSRQPVLKTTAVLSSPVGDYDIYFEENAEGANYEISSYPGKLHVIKATPVINFTDLPALTYGDQDVTMAASSTNEEVPVTYSSSNSAVATVENGIFHIVGAGTVTIRASQAASSSYDAYYKEQNVTIAKADLTATAINVSREYGDANPALYIDYTGYKYNDASSTGVISVLPTASTTATLSSPVGDYNIVVQGGSSANYNILTQNGTLTVLQAVLSIDPNDVTRYYGDQNPEFRLTYTGFKNGETERTPGVMTSMPVSSVNADALSPVGLYIITASGATASNYQVNHLEGDLRVVPAVLTATADNKSKVYGEENPALTITYSGFKNGETENTAGVITTFPQASTDAVTTSPAGAYDINVSADGLAGNYTITPVSGKLTIDAAVLTVTANSAEKIYGQENPVFTVSYSGFKNSDTENTPGVMTSKATALTTATRLSGAGPYSLSPEGAVAPNYTIQKVNGVLTVHKAELTATADNNSRKYGEANPAFVIRYSGFVNGDSKADIDQLPTASTTADKLSPVGTYDISVDNNGADNNYSITRIKGALTVGKAMLIAKADNKSKDVGAANPALTVTYSGFANGENASVIDVPASLSTNAIIASPAGDYEILIKDAADNNYEFDYVKGTLSVGKRHAEIAVNNNNVNFTYGDSDFALQAVSNNTVTPLQYFSADAGVASVDAAGTVHITGSGTTILRISQAPGNGYGAAEDVYREIHVAKASLRVIAENVVRNFGEDNPELPLRYEGFVNNDTELVLSSPAIGATAAGRTSPAGVYDITVSGASSPDYDITYTSGRLTVTTVSARMTLVDIPDKIYGDAAFKVIAISNNTESVITYSSDNAAVATVDADGTVHITGAGTTTIRASQDPSSSFGQGVVATTLLKVNKKLLKVIADNKSKKQGEDNPALTMSFDGWVNGDGLNALTAVPVISTSAVKNSALGNHQIQVTGGSAANYTLSPQNGTLIINPANSVITFNDIPLKKYGDADFKVDALTSSYGTLTYSLSNLNQTYPAAEIDAATGMVKILNAGQAVITISVTGDDHYTLDQDVSLRLTVIKATPVITLPDPGTKTYGDPEFSANASSTNTVTPLTYASSNTAVATVSSAGMIKLESGGYSNIRVAQAFSNNYEEATASVTMFVGKKVSSFILQPFATKTYLDVPFSPVVTGNTGPVTYTSSNSRVAVIADGQIVITGAGTTRITATQAETGGYSAATDSKNLLVNGAVPVINFSALPTDKIYGDADVAINAVSSVPGIPLTYTSSNTAVASIVNGKLHIVGAGSTTVTVSQPASSNYTAASTQQVFTVGKATVTITAEDKEKVVGQDNPALTVTYSGFKFSETEAVFESLPQIITDAVKTSAPGIYTITPKDAVDDNYTFVYRTARLVILDIAKITFNQPAAKTYGDADYKLVASSNNSNVALVYRGDNPSVATVDANGNVHITGTGTVNVTVSQVRDHAFTAAEEVVRVLTVNKKMLTVRADDKVSIVGTWPEFTVSYTGWAYNETVEVLSRKARATVETDGTNAGQYVITASGAEAANYEFTYVTGKLILTTDGLSFWFDEMPVKTYLDADFDPGAKTNTNTAIYYSSNNPEVAVIVDNKVKIVGAGTAEITATVKGVVSPAQDLTLKRILTVNKARQVITFETIPGLKRGASAYQLVASSTSGLPIGFVTSNSFVGSLDGSLLSPLRLGSGTITASQPGDKNYLPAADVILPFSVTDEAGTAIIVPKLITPNGDGRNDVLYIEGITEYPDNHFVVVNRNGTKVYEAKNYNNGSVLFTGRDFFNGSYRTADNLLPEGTYFYVLTYKDKDGKGGRTAGYFVVKFEQ